MEIAISLGSNLGDRLAHLQEAVARLNAIPSVETAAKSPVYETSRTKASPKRKTQCSNKCAKRWANYKPANTQSTQSNNKAR